MNQFKIGVIGAGAITALHLDVIRAIDHIEVVSITSRTMDKAYKLAKVYNIPHIYRTVEDFLSGVEVDAIMVLVSADQMAAVLRAVIPCGLPLFVEKPPALSLRVTKALVDLSDKYNTLVMVGLNRRIIVYLLKVLKSSKKNGKLLAVSIEGHERFWKLNQSSFSEAITDAWLYANSLHTIDLLRFFGGEIADCHALSTSLQQPNGDQFVASLRFSSGCLGQYISCWYSPGGWSVKLYGEGVTVSFKPLEEGCWEDVQWTQWDH